MFCFCFSNVTPCPAIARAASLASLQRWPPARAHTRPHQDAPYLVGILHSHASRLGKIEGLADVLCMNLDKNKLKMLNMPNPCITVPDMLKRVKSTGGGAEAALRQDAGKGPR
jgi:hypothetical protein